MPEIKLVVLWKWYGKDNGKGSVVCVCVCVQLSVGECISLSLCHEVCVGAYACVQALVILKCAYVI